MKKLFYLILLSLIMISCKNNRLTISEVDNKGGRYFYKGEPFSGVIFDKNKDNILIVEFQVVNGYNKGYYKKFGRYGKKLLELNFINSYTIDGHFVFYYDINNWKTTDYNEVIQMEGTLIDGKLVGEYVHNFETLYGDLILEKYTLDSKSNVLSWEKKSDQPGVILGKYKNGIKELYYNNGRLKSRIKYTNCHLDFSLGGLSVTVNEKLGNITGEYITYYENGNIEEKGSFDNGLKKGKWITYYENGQINKKDSYNENGKLTGPFEYYFENGQTFQKGNYHNGNLDGWWEQHYRGGVPREIEYKTLYKDGFTIQLTEQY